MRRLVGSLGFLGVPPALLLALGATSLWGQQGGEARGAAVQVEWHPERPVPGRLFVLRVGPSLEADLASVEGRSAGEVLHFHADGGGAFESLVPVPIDEAGAASVDVVLHYRNGQQERVGYRVPLSTGSYEHERLTVAPRFGRAPTSEEAARSARDVARARSVSEASHRTPRLWTREMILPRVDRVTSGFGNGREFNGQVTSRHMGLDLDGEPGDTVYATARGVVELVDDFLLAGNIVYLNHGGGLVSGYFHLSRQLVAQGDSVQAGTPIGLVGATGRVTGPHLHWVVRYGHISVDPRSLLEAAR